MTFFVIALLFSKCVQLARSYQTKLTSMADSEIPAAQKNRVRRRSSSFIGAGAIPESGEAMTPYTCHTGNSTTAEIVVGCRADAKR